MGRLSIMAICLLALLVAQSTSHFLLNYPPTIGFDDDLEGQAPCGSFTIDFLKDNVTNFHVDGDAIALTSTHPMATWLFRATLDQSGTGNWTTLLPAVSQTGLGAYCERAVTVPSNWAGSKGVIQVVQDAVDGLLYQCSTVNFVAGTANPPDACSNATGLSAVYTTDAKLSSIPTTASATSSQAPTTGSPTSTTSSTTKASAAETVASYSGLSSFVGLLMIASATLLASLL